MAEVKPFNLGDAFGTAAKGMSYFDYIKNRGIERENRQMALEDRQRKIQAGEQAQKMQQQKMQQSQMMNAQKDMDLIMTNIDTESPTFDQDFNKAMGWAGSRNPQISRKAYAMSQRSPEEKKMFIQNLKSQRGLDKTDMFERGKPFTNEAGERVVPIYNKQTQQVVRQENLGKPQGKSNITDIMSEKEQTLGKMLANNEIDVTQLPKRGSSYNNIVSYAKTLNPDLNVREMTADYSLSKNPTFRQRALTAEVLPDILNEVVAAGKKLNFSDVKKFGGFQKYYKSQLNDPDLVEYMALRNDAMMELASVMRGGGMTDKAHAAEEEAMNPTMSPKALDAWFKAQMKALKPRLALQEKIINRGTKSKSKNIEIEDYKNASDDELEKILRGGN